MTDRKKRRTAPFILALFMLLTAAGCGGRNTAEGEEQPLILSAEREEKESMTEKEKDPPAAGSDEMRLYAYAPAGSPERCVVNYYGQRMNEYALDTEGSIITRSGEILIAGENVKEFKALGSLSFKPSARTLQLTAGTTLDNSGNSVVTQFAVASALELCADTAGAVNRIVIVSSSNPAVADVRAGNELRFSTDKDISISPNETALIIPENGNVPLILTGKTAGTAVIRARALSGGASAAASVTVRNGDISVVTNAPRDPSLTGLVIAAGHIHEYTAAVILPDLDEEGYTLYTCSCGSSYTEPYPASEAPEETHRHSYSSHTVPPTADEQGFTVHVCECGDTYRDAYVDRLK